MKLQEVDSTINEAITDWIKAGIGTLGAAAGYSKGAEYASAALEKSHFVNEFTKKIGGMLATIWPKIQKQQQAYIAAQKSMQAIAANQPVVYAGKTINPTDPNYDAVKAENQQTAAAAKDTAPTLAAAAKPASALTLIAAAAVQNANSGSDG